MNYIEMVLTEIRYDSMDRIILAEDKLWSNIWLTRQ